MRSVLVILLALSCVTVFAKGAYQFRQSNAYQALAPADRDKLEQVHRDFVLLWGALDMYAEAHSGQVPTKLSDLVPLYLKELPRDPFATDKTAKQKNIGSYLPSCDGYGYRYEPGHGNAFVLCSVGLRGFPYLAEQGNVDLYIAKGIWTGGRQFVR
jgi:hypothetical protein